MIKKKKAIWLTKFERTIHPKNGIFPLLTAYCKNSEKLVQWMEDMAQVDFGLFLRKKTWI